MWISDAATATMRHTRRHTHTHTHTHTHRESGGARRTRDRSEEAREDDHDLEAPPLEAHHHRGRERHLRG
jgi:hypothetical protein